MNSPSHISRFTVVQPIAAGGMGEVLLARDEKLDRLVAIKLLREGFDSDDLLQRFEEEARNVAKLTHPNIVTIYEYGAHEGRPYIAMEYVAGHSLADLIRRKMPLTVARRIRLIEEVCSGLGHAHKAHLVHRDVKPANLMVTTSGMVKVLDFGIAKLRGTDRTQKGMIVGTVNYMSPEQITGQGVDHRSDIFAVGAVLHEVLTYDQAFKGDLTTAMFNIVHGQPEPLATRCPGLDPAFQTVVNRCLAKDPADRYQDLTLLKRDLAKLRRPIEDDDSEVVDTLMPLDVEKTMVFKTPSSSGVPGKAIGPDTRRALGAALASGESAIAGGQFESAVRFAEQALALESGNVSAQDLLARAGAQRDKARVASAIRNAKEALAADRLEEARAALEAATALAPESPTLRAVVDSVEERAADLERFERTVVLAREQLDAHNLKQARQLAETAVVIRPADTELNELRAAIEQAEAAQREWLHAEFEAIDGLLAGTDVEAAARRLEAVKARSPEASGLTARADAVRAARESEARAAQARRDEAEARRRSDEEKQREESDRRRAEEARQREEAAREREAQARARAERERAERVAALLETAGRADAPLASRASALTELARIEPQQASLAALKAELDAALAEAARQKALDEALAAGQALLAQEQFDAAAAKAAEVSKARPGDGRAAQLTAAVDSARKAHARLREALGKVEALAAQGRFDDALAGLTGLDPRHRDVVALHAQVESARASAKRRQRLAALGGQIRALATNRAVLAVGGTAAALVVAIWLWPAGAPAPAADPTSPATVPADTSPGPAVTTAAPAGPTTEGATAPTVAAPRPATAPGTTESVRPSPTPTTGPSVAAPRVLPASPPTTTVLPPAATTARPPEKSSTIPSTTPSGPPKTSPTNTPPPGAVSETSAPAKPPANAPPAVELPAAPPSAAPSITPAAPPPADETTVQRQADDARIRALVGAFGRAYQNRDVGELKRAWPAMPRNVENSYRNVFQSYSRLGWAQQGADVVITGDQAVARASVQVELRELRSNDATTERRTYLFRLERRQGGWTIASVENQR